MTEAEDYIEKFTKEFAKKEFNIDVKVRFMNTYRLLGNCLHYKGIIKFSKPFIEANKDNKKVLEALAIHECCHLKQPNHKTGFKLLCKSYGIATHTKDEKNTVMPKLKKYYLYKCSNCDNEYKRIRYKEKAGACTRCCIKYNNGKYSEKYRFKLVGWINETKEVK